MERVSKLCFKAGRYDPSFKVGHDSLCVECGMNEDGLVLKSRLLFILDTRHW